MTALAACLGAATAQKHVEGNADDEDRSHAHTGHVEIDELWCPIVNLPDTADGDAREREPAVFAKEQTQYAWDDDDQGPGVLEEADAVNPLHGEGQPDDAYCKKQNAPEEFAEGIHVVGSVFAFLD